ncbi:chaperone NapD [Candidatus Poribacteria bacterium]|nr:chaperone NapD [Candidatus Poribacteria bacterium]
MPISGHVVFFKEEHRGEVTARLLAFPEVLVGDAALGGAPIVTETKTVAEETELVRRIEAIPGVEGVSLIYHNFEDCAPVAASTPGENGHAG